MIKNDLASLAAFSADPWTPDNEFFASAEAAIEPLWRNLIFPFISDCDFSVCVDLAAGHGRNTQYLLKHAQHLIVVDYHAGNIEVCKHRFAEFINVCFVKNNGFDLEPIERNTVTLIYCFDSMVHFDSDVVRSYLKDIFRVLRPKGRAFLHHSNYTAGSAEWGKSPHSRNFMSRELLSHYAGKENLQVLRQKPLTWGDIENLDCLTLLEKPA